MIFRKAKTSDLTVVAKMAKKLWPYETINDLHQTLQNSLSKKNETLLIVLNGKIPIAFATLSIRKD